MQCPLDQTELRLAERHGVNIDASEWDAPRGRRRRRGGWLGDLFEFGD